MFGAEESERRAREEAELNAAIETAKGQINKLTFRQLSGDAISQAEFSDAEEYEVEYDELSDINMELFARSGHQVTCPEDKIKAQQSALAKQIFIELKKNPEVITPQEERHLQAIADIEGCSNLCEIMGGIGIDRAKILEIKDETNRKKLQDLLENLDKLRVEKEPSKLTRAGKTRIGFRLGTKKSGAGSGACAKRNPKIQEEIDILNDIIKSKGKKGDLVTKRQVAIEQLQDRINKGEIKPTDADMKELNGFVDKFNAYISGAAGGGNRARRVRRTKRTKRTKGKSRGRAGKATRVRRNNNNSNNNAKTKRNKGKKRRTKRA